VTIPSDTSYPHSKRLLLGPIRLSVLERKATGALVKLVKTTNHGLVAREHDAVQSKGREDAAADAAKHVARLTGPRVSTVAVESDGRVVGGGNGEHGVGVGGYAFA
jgi:hypothetical protein